MAKKKIEVVQKPDVPEVPVEILAQEIETLAKGMRKLDASRLKRSDLITLLHRTSSVPRRSIEVILNCLEDLENLYLKKES